MYRFIGAVIVSLAMATLGFAGGIPSHSIHGDYVEARTADVYTGPCFANARPAPEEAYFDKNLGEFVLPYDVVRRSMEPDATLMSFLDSTYRAAADLGRWDRAALECLPGVPRRPRPL